NLPGARSHRELAAEQALHERNGRGIIPMPGPEGDGDGIAALSLPPTNRSTPTPTVSTMSLTVAPRQNVPAAQLPKSDPLPSRLSASPSVHRDESQPVLPTPAAQSPTPPD